MTHGISKFHASFLPNQATSEFSRREEPSLRVCLSYGNPDRCEERSFKERNCHRLFSMKHEGNPLLHFSYAKECILFKVKLPQLINLNLFCHLLTVRQL